MRPKTIPVLLAAAAALLLAAAAGPLADAQPPSPLALPEGATGRLIVPRSRDVWQVAANSGVEERLLAGAPLTTVTQVSWAPDGRRAAYSLFRFWSAERPSGSDLYTVDTDSGERTLVLGAIGEDASFTEPVWTPDGASLVYTAVLRDSSSRFGDTTSQIERVPLTGGPRAALVENGFSPALSRDGRHLAFLRESSRAGEGEVALWLADGDGANPRVLLADRRFSSLAFPRVAPDGERLAFAAVGGPVPARRATGSFLPLFAPRVASAHGPPWDLWEIRLDGSGLRRLTELAEDDPSLAWSPDGRWLAFQGGNGLYLLDPVSSAVYPVNETVGFGGIDWTS